MHKRVVLFIDNSFTFGGAINSLRTLMLGLDRSKYEPVLVTAQPKNVIDHDFSFVNRYHIKSKLMWVHDRNFRKSIGGNKFLSRPEIVRWVMRIRYIYWFFVVTLPEAFFYYSIGRKHKVNLIHLNNIFGSQLAGIIAAKMLRVPCVAHMRDFEQIGFLTRLFSRFIDFHVAISTSIRSRLLDLQVPESRISIIYNAIDLDTFDPDIDCNYLKEEYGLHDEKLFGIFGRVVKWKGIIEFIHVANLVFKAVDNTKALIIKLNLQLC